MGGGERERKAEGEGVGPGEEGKEWAGWALPLRMGKEGKEWAGWALPVPLKALSFSFFFVLHLYFNIPPHVQAPPSLKREN